MNSDTALTDIEDTLKKFIKRDDIDIILINQNVSADQWFKDTESKVLVGILAYMVAHLFTEKCMLIGK